MPSNPKAFKHGLNRNAVRRIARNIKKADPSFADAAFVRAATGGLDVLELKARVGHVVEALRRYLPDDGVEAIDVLARAGELWDRPDSSDPLDSFAAWPVIDAVGEIGLEHFDVSMEALRRLTPLFSSEFAIRGLVKRYETRALKRLARWTTDPDPHVRRLVSEGTRPRLPWGRRLERFQADPRPILGLLEALKDDSAEYVRRSVGNSLNDIAKDNPDIVVDVCQRWATNASAERLWIIRHATRTLVKEGHPQALKILGFDPHAKILVKSFSLSPRTLTLGEDLTLSFEIRSTSDRPQSLVIDFVVHHVKQSGNRTSKVFKLKSLELSPRKTVSISKKHRLRVITTRRYYSGRHPVELLVNGKSRGLAEFDLKV